MSSLRGGDEIGFVRHRRKYMISTIIILLASCAGSFYLGALFGNRKRILTEKEQRLLELSQCECLRKLCENHDENKFFMVRCESYSGHNGPHKHVVQKPFSNAGQIVWWTDEQSNQKLFDK